MDQSGKTRPVAALSIPDAGTYLGVSSDTVRRLVRAGEIPHARIGNSIRIRHVDLEEYLQEKTTRKWERVDGRGRRAAG
ncbi:MAG: helix-turn-helix domain-containing protein [Planctomycetota bacterium]|jgi:excisionase family DNA binding protein